MISILLIVSSIGAARVPDSGYQHSKGIMNWPRVYTIMGGQDSSSSQETIINRNNGVSVESLAGDHSLTSLIRLGKNKAATIRAEESKENLSFRSFQFGARTGTDLLTKKAEAFLLWNKSGNSTQFPPN